MMPGTFEASLAKDGVAFDFTDTIRDARFRPPWFPPEDANLARIHERMLLSYVRKGAVVPLTHADKWRAEACGLPVIPHAHFLVAKNKPEPPPLGGDMVEAERRGDESAIQGILRHWRVVTDFKPGLNLHLRPRKYSMGTAAALRDAMTAGDRLFVCA